MRSFVMYLLWQIFIVWFTLLEQDENGVNSVCPRQYESFKSAQSTLCFSLIFSGLGLLLSELQWGNSSSGKRMVHHFILPKVVLLTKNT